MAAGPAEASVPEVALALVLPADLLYLDARAEALDDQVCLAIYVPVTLGRCAQAPLSCATQNQRGNTRSGH